MKRDWLQYFKDRANTIIVQPEGVAMITDKAPPMPDFSKVKSADEIVNAGVLLTAYAALATQELLIRVMARD